MMRENIRSGRKANFYITENSFVDNYAKAVGPQCAVIYNVLERYMNSETRSTWVGTAKIAAVVGVHQRTVQRCLRVLEEFKLIKILKNASATTYVVMPVPPRAKSATVPLFDAIEDEDILWRGETSNEDTTSESSEATVAPSEATESSPQATPTPGAGDICVSAYKEEQNSVNKTNEQEYPPLKECALRIMNIFDLPETSFGAVTAAVKAELELNQVLPDEIVHNVTKEVFRAGRNGISVEEFFNNSVARICATTIIRLHHLNAATSNLIQLITEAIKAESKHTKLPMEEAARRISKAATEDAKRGIPIDKFYFADMKWRVSNGNGRGKTTAERNLEAAVDARTAARRAIGLDH